MQIAVIDGKKISLSEWVSASQSRKFLTVQGVGQSQLEYTIKTWLHKITAFYSWLVWSDHNLVSESPLSACERISQLGVNLHTTLIDSTQEHDVHFFIPVEDSDFTASKE